MPKKFDKEPVAWITRGGKHIPIFDTKVEKVSQINEAISRSETAVSKGAKAELLPNGKIQYSLLGKSSFGDYKMKATLNDILNLLNGDDVRNLKKIFGRQ